MLNIKTKKINHYLQRIILTPMLTPFLLTACGGGGGGSDDGNTVDPTPVVVVENLAPVAYAGDDQAVLVDSQVTLNGVGSDADGDTLSYSWSITAQPEGSTESLTSTSTAQTQFTASVTGHYILEFLVSDGISTSTDSVGVIVDGGVNNSSMQISSAAFKNTGSTFYNLPLSYTCYGANDGVSPLLSWSGIPDSAQSLALTMHSLNSDNTIAMQFALTNIDPSINTLPAGDFSIGDVVIPYSAPCAAGAGIETFYTFTLFALTEELEPIGNATNSEVLALIEAASSSKQTLTTRRVSWDAASLAANLHVPTSVPSTCEEKTSHLNEYSFQHKVIACDEVNNTIGVSSHVATGSRSSLLEDTPLVGASEWIGRIPLPEGDSFSFPIEPIFHDTEFFENPQSNMWCTDNPARGTSVDGIKILSTYRKHSASAETEGMTCGPNDGSDRTVDMVVFGSIDQCHGHAPNGDGYHLHGSPICLMDVQDPSKPIAYMLDGLPLYFGQSGGTVFDNENVPTTSNITETNYGAGRYEHLDYRPADVIDGSNPLNECNAYDVNGDGDVSGYVYYTTKDTPYTIGCFMGELQNLSSPNLQVDGWSWENSADRAGWVGQNVGQVSNVAVTNSYETTYQDKTYSMTELYPKEDINQTGTTYLHEGVAAGILWRILDNTDNEYREDASCFEFRYRSDLSVINSDETETLCATKVISQETLNFTPFGNSL